jgi:hypothetical protein
VDLEEEAIRPCDDAVLSSVRRHLFAVNIYAGYLVGFFLSIPQFQSVCVCVCVCVCLSVSASGMVWFVDSSHLSIVSP